MYSDEQLLRDFVQRTEANLQAVDWLHANPTILGNNAIVGAPPKVYEVTQLVNSLLGLIVFTKEGLFRNIPNKTIIELQEDGWPTAALANRVSGTQPELKLFTLVSYIRNAVSHFNVQFEAENGEVSKIKMWNYDLRSESIDWEVLLSVGDLRIVVERYLDVIRDALEVPRRRRGRARRLS